MPDAMPRVKSTTSWRCGSTAAYWNRCRRHGWFNVQHVCGSHVNLAGGWRLPVQAVTYSIHTQGNPSLGEAAG